MAEDPQPPDSYTPDPAAETAMTIDAFFHALARAVPDEEDLADRVRRRHQALVADQAHRVVDEASRYNLSLTLLESHNAYVLTKSQKLFIGKIFSNSLSILRQAFIVSPLF